MRGKIRLLLGALALLVVVVLAWFFLLNPIRSDVRSTQADIDSERAQLAQAQIELAQAESTREEGKRNEARLLELAKLMPTAEEIPSLVLQIEDLAGQSGIDFTAITPGKIEQSKYADGRILPLELEFTGTFFDLNDFIFRLEAMAAGPGRLLAVKRLELSLGNVENLSPGTSPALLVKMTLYTFLAGGGAKAPAAAQPSGDSGTTDSTAASSQ
jgi:Tfp pilus assembly protein PilO